MKGSMMHYPLTLHHLLERIPRYYAGTEIVSRLPDERIHRCTYGDFHARALRLAEALQREGLKPGDRVGTLCWNHYAHLEAYYGVPAAGGVIHTLNLRLHPTELAYIVNHAADRFLIVDDVLLPTLERFRAGIRPERVFVVNHTGMTLPPGYEDYEALLASASGTFNVPALEEDDACAMCFTSGTTGNPKGVLYSHRAVVLHAMAFAMPDCFAISQRDVLMALAPMFHANAHGLPHVGVLMGSKLVFPGRQVDPPNVLGLFESEQVNFATAVPTVWFMLLEAIEKEPDRWKLAPGFRAFVGGTAAPEALFRRMDAIGIRMIQVWGMTETTPVATCATLKRHMLDWPEDEQYAVRTRQGRALPFVDLRIENDEGIAPWDGETMGEVQVRGPWVASSYYEAPESAGQWTEDGWLRTGDIATVDPEGYVRITDRAKDLIKTGGEWVSSVDVESALMDHPSVQEAGVIAVPHPKWEERPVAIVVLHPGKQATADELRAFLAKKFSKWQLPDEFVFANELPHTSTGKLSKLELRRQFRKWSWQRPEEALPAR